MLVNLGPSQQSSKEAMEMRCYRKILHISYNDHVANEEVRAKIQQATRPHEDLLTIVKRRKLRWYGHASRSSGLVKSIFLYARESWTPTAELQRGIQATEKSFRHEILRISCKDRVTNEEVRAKIMRQLDHTKTS